MILPTIIQHCNTRLGTFFESYLQKLSFPAVELQKAMIYGSMNGGKRIRPLLVYATGYTLGASWENLDIPASAIELIHSYSLIHDDLPAMDNSDLRRGKLSCHKAFSEAIAILAGDALLPLAFEIISSHPAELNNSQRIAMLTILSKAIGANGMVGGQAIDIKGTNSIEELKNMYQLKTGALLTASMQLGAIAADIQDIDILQALMQYANHIGLAFQIQDDILDAISSTITGKPQDLDKANKKITYPLLIGIENSHNAVKKLFETAITAISILGNKAEILRDLAHFLLQRKK